MTMPSASDLKMNQHPRLAFSLGEYRRRYDAVMKAMEAKGIEVMLVRTPENIAYLTGYVTPGYYGYHCLILSLDQAPTLVVRLLEQTNVFEYSWLADSVPVTDDRIPYEVTVDTLRQRGLATKRIGVEKTSFFSTIDEYENVRAKLADATLVDGSGLIEWVRVIKSPEELALMRRCAKQLDHGSKAGLDALKAGTTEDLIAAEVHRELISRGCEYGGLPHFITSGPRITVTHSTWEGRKIAKGDPVFYELYYTKHRYSSCIMFTASDGAPNDTTMRIADASERALEAGMRALKPGVPCEEVDRALHAEFVKAGFGDYHRHRAAYSLGMCFPPDWGEGQILSLKKGEKRLVQKDMVFHMVPAAYIYRKTGAGISATLHVTENGCEPFSMYPGKYVVKGGRPASAKRVKVSKAKAKAKPKAKSKPKAKAKSRAKKR
jgi:Xaa-Pro dipeptidase